MNTNLFATLPLWGLFVFTVLVVLLSIEGGLRLGQRRRRLEDHEKEAPVGSVVGATLGLLAFLLAFTFGLAASRFDARRHLLLDEVNAIRTTALQARLLLEPENSELSQLLRQYVNHRVAAAQNPALLEQVITESKELHGKLWSHAVVLAHANPSSEIVSLFISSLSEMIELHTTRVVIGARYRIPLTIWLALYSVAILAMAAVGYQFGLSGARSLQSNLVLALTFSGVIWLIADLDRATEGFLKVSQQPMVELQQELNTSTR
jgi:hypothetical protein